MPPNLNVYLLIRHRNFEMINQFIADCVDRLASENRGDEEIRMLPLSVTAEDEWEPSLTLTNVVQRGLSYPRRAFLVYLKPNNPEFAYVILGFTVDDQLIFGLAIDDAGQKLENLIRAKALLEDIGLRYQAYLGLILVEMPPPLSEHEFRESPISRHAEYFIQFDLQQ